LNKTDTRSSADEVCGKTSETTNPLRRRSTSFTKNITTTSNSTTTTGSRAPTDELQQKLNRRLSRVEDPNALEDFESQVKQSTIDRRSDDRTRKQDKPSS